MDILSLADRALVAYIKQTLPGLLSENVRPAKDSEIKSLPQTTCWSHSFTVCHGEDYSGNFEVESFIEIRTDAVIQPAQFSDEPRRNAFERVEATFKLFLTPNSDSSGSALGEAITAAARASASEFQNFTVTNCRIVEGNQGFNPKTLRDRGNAWIDVIHLELTCCPGNVS